MPTIAGGGATAQVSSLEDDYAWGRVGGAAALMEQRSSNGSASNARANDGHVCGFRQLGRRQVDEMWKWRVTEPIAVPWLWGRQARRLRGTLQGAIEAVGQGFEQRKNGTEALEGIMHGGEDGNLPNVK